MSADNGIYIISTLTPKQPEIGKEYEYRVRHCMAIENLYYQYDPHIYYIWSYFHKGSVFGSYKDAMAHAGELAEDYDILEYGISFAGTFNFPFPTEEEADKWAEKNDPTCNPYGKSHQQ